MTPQTDSNLTSVQLFAQAGARAGEITWLAASYMGLLRDMSTASLASLLLTSPMREATGLFSHCHNRN